MTAKNGSLYPGDTVEDGLLYLTDGEFSRKYGKTKAEARLTDDDRDWLRDLKVKW